MKSAPWKASARFVVAEMREGQPVLLDERAAVLLDDRQRVRVDVVQHDLAAFEHLALQDVADGAIAELGAPRADEDDSFLHVGLLIQCVDDSGQMRPSIRS